MMVRGKKGRIDSGRWRHPPLLLSPAWRQWEGEFSANLNGNPEILSRIMSAFSEK